MIALRRHAACIASAAGRSARQRECDADEAGWELQIRRMAKYSTREIERPVAAPRAVTAEILAVVSKIGRHDVLLLPRTLPIGAGHDTENLVCGSCSAIVAAGLSRMAARTRHPEGDRVVVRCTCKALNLLYGVARASGGKPRRRVAAARGASFPA